LADPHSLPASGSPYPVKPWAQGVSAGQNERQFVEQPTDDIGYDGDALRDGS